MCREDRRCIGNASQSFGVSATAPAVQLNYPTSNLYLNDILDVLFNFTATDVTGISSCTLYGDWPSGTFASKYVWESPTSGVAQTTTISTIEEGTHKYNVFCNDTSDNGAWAITNRTFTTDITLPSINLNIITVTGSQTVSVNKSIVDTNIDSTSCKYSIYNLAGTIDGLYSNVSTSCTGIFTATVSSFATYNLTFFASDLAGNTRTASSLFTVSQSGGQPGGGGGGSTTTVITQNLTDICGNNICEEGEDFYSCQTDCPGFNIDYAILSCFKGDFDNCIISDINQFLLILLGAAFIIAIFARVKDKRTGKSVPVYRYYLARRK